MLCMAICDLNPLACSLLENILLDISKYENERMEIEVYYSGEHLYNSLLQGTYYDVIWLSIELKSISGIEIGKRIREELNDERTHIVFLSDKPNYAIDLFQVRPLDFIITPLSNDMLSNDMLSLDVQSMDKIRNTFSTARRLIRNNDKVFEYQKGTEIIRIPYSDIMYFESDKRKVNIITTHSFDSFYGNLQDILSRVSQEKFLPVHKSYLVNSEYIVKYEYSQVTLLSGYILPISQANRKKVRMWRLRAERYN